MRWFKDLLISLKEITLDYVRSRIFPVTLVIILLFVILINRLFTIQIEQGEQYVNTFEYKSEKTLTVNSIRGNIYDVNGKLLAYNKISYTLTFGNSNLLPDEAKKMNISENQLKNRIIGNTLNILKTNGDDIDSNFRIDYKAGKYKFNVKGNVLRNFLKDVYAADKVDDLTDKQLNSSAEDVVKYLKKLFEIGKEYDDETGMKILACRYNL